jgi:uncharacterized protein YraI
MKIPSSQSSGSFLRSPIILGGLAVVLIALIAVVALGVLGGGNGGGGGPATKTAGTSSPKQTASSDHLTGKAKSTVNVRSDPGNAFQALGVLRNGTEVEIVAKSEDGKWFQIVYPSGSNLRGWVLAESLDVNGDMSGLGVATPENIPVPVVPTSPAVTPTTTPTPSNLTPTPSPTPPIPLPDLVISGTAISGGKLVITVTDQGLGPLTSATVAVSVFDLAGTGLLGSGSAGPLTLTPGASIDVKTNYAIPASPVQLLVIVDPQGTIPETDDTNNRLSVAIGGGGAQPTKTPTQQPTQQPTPTP